MIKPQRGQRLRDGRRNTDLHIVIIRGSHSLKHSSRYPTIFDNRTYVVCNGMRHLSVRVAFPTLNPLEHPTFLDQY